MIISQRIEIDPTEKQKKVFNQYFGYARYCYNKSLDKWKELYLLSKENANTPKPTQYMVRNLLKKERQEWESLMSPLVLDTACEDLGSAYMKLFKKQGKLPRYKSRRNSKRTFRFYRKDENTIKVLNDNRLLLTGFGGKYGSIKMKEEIRFEDYTIKTVTISQRADKYFASFTMEFAESPYTQLSKRNKSFVGVDLGVKTFAIITDDKDESYISESIIKSLEPKYRQIARIQKSLSKKKKDSKRAFKARTKLQKFYLRIQNQQSNHVHETTSFLCKNYRYICIEDLQVSNMIKNRKLSKVISRSLFYEFRRQVEYKSELYGNTVIIADKFFPSSQLCSHCGAVKEKGNKLKLSQRTYKCSNCGEIINRDINASINLREYGRRRIVNYQNN